MRKDKDFIHLRTEIIQRMSQHNNIMHSTQYTHIHNSHSQYTTEKNNTNDTILIICYTNNTNDSIKLC